MIAAMIMRKRDMGYEPDTVCSQPRRLAAKKMAERLPCKVGAHGQRQEARGPGQPDAEHGGDETRLRR
jgi:hypothetical protein